MSEPSTQHLHLACPPEHVTVACLSHLLSPRLHPTASLVAGSLQNSTVHCTLLPTSGNFLRCLPRTLLFAFVLGNLAVAPRTGRRFSVPSAARDCRRSRVCRAISSLYRFVPSLSPWVRTMFSRISLNSRVRAYSFDVSSSVGRVGRPRLRASWFWVVTFQPPCAAFLFLAVIPWASSHSSLVLFLSCHISHAVPIMILPVFRIAVLICAFHLPPSPGPLWLTASGTSPALPHHPSHPGYCSGHVIQSMSLHTWMAPIAIHSLWIFSAPLSWMAPLLRHVSTCSMVSRHLSGQHLHIPPSSRSP